MTMDLGPFCVHCGRPTRFSINDVYQCKQGCEAAAAEAEAGARAMGEYQAAAANLAEIGRRTTIPAPAPPSLELTGTPEHVLELLQEHPELADTVPVAEPDSLTEEELVRSLRDTFQAPVVEMEPEVTSVPPSQPRPRGKRRRR